jgi:hypothetical protein
VLNLGVLDVPFGVVLVLLDLSELFHSEPLNVGAGRFIDFLDVAFGKLFFVLVDHVSLDMIMAIEADSSIGGA